VFASLPSAVNTGIWVAMVASPQVVRNCRRLISITIEFRANASYLLTVWQVILKLLKKEQILLLKQLN
jgi:hypothetical protein